MTSGRVLLAASCTLGLWLGPAGSELLSAAAKLQARRTPDLSGRWVLTTPSDVVPSNQPTLILGIANELKVTQDAVSIIVEHPAKGGSHPGSGIHRFGSSGTVGSGGGQSRYDTFWFGAELIISSRAQLAGTDGVRLSSSAKWSLEADGRLEIRIIEERTGVITERVTLVYRKE